MLKYRDFKLIEPDPSVCERVDRLINETDGSVFQESFLHRQYAEIFSTKLFYLVDDPENIRLAAPVHLRTMKNGARQYNIGQLYDIPYTGFVGMGAIDFRWFNVGFFESLTYVGFPYVNMQYPGGSTCAFGQTAMIDLAITEEDIFNKVIRSNRRNMIRKAIARGISTEIFFDEEGWSLFLPALIQLHKRLGGDDAVLEFHRRLFIHYASRNQAFIGVAFKNSAFLSGILVLGNLNYMHYYKGASKGGISNDGHGELLQWEAIKMSRSIGSAFYDLCDLNKQRLPEIYNFKSSFAKERFNYPKYYYSTPGYKVLNRLSKLMSKSKTI